MEVPEESFHWSSWDSRTCYPRRAFIQGLTDDKSDRRALTSDYKRFPLPSSPAKGRRRCCLGLKPETRKRKSPENHLWPRPAGRHERRTAISFKSLVFRGPEVVFWDPKRTRLRARKKKTFVPSLRSSTFSSSSLWMVWSHSGSPEPEYAWKQ